MEGAKEGGRQDKKELGVGIAFHDLRQRGGREERRGGGENIGGGERDGCVVVC